MAEDEIITTIVEEAEEFERVADLVSSEPSVQISLGIMVVGLIAIFAGHRKLSNWISSKRFGYSRPHYTSFLRFALLPIFALALISATNAYITATGLFEPTSTEVAVEAVAGVSSPKIIFLKIIDTINILIIGFTVANIIPIIFEKRDSYRQEKDDYDAWYEMRGFPDDEGDLFHKCFKWTPPKQSPEDLTEEEFQKHLKSPEGLKFLEEFRTSKGVAIGSYEKLVSDPFDVWSKSERKKYEKYFDNCVSGNNQSGQKLSPGAKPEEIFHIDVWREEKRIRSFEPIIPSSRPPGYAAKTRQGEPMSPKRIFRIAVMIGVIIGVVSWWGVDLVILATATGGLAIGVGFALQETMQNYFAYFFIRKDKIFKVGDRIALESGYNGYIHKITPRVTYVRNALNESIAVIPTRNLVAGQTINYTKDVKLVPAVVDVGVSYLNNPKQVAAILVKVGKRAMKEVKDSRGRHLVRQKRCPYLDENKPSCGCDKELLVDLSQPTVRFNHFNDSSLDFSVWVYVRDYGAQFKTKSDMRNIMYEEFKKYDIRIPWPIRTIYEGNEKKEAEEIGSRNDERKKVVDDYGIGDLERGSGDE